MGEPVAAETQWLYGSVKPPPPPDELEGTEDGVMAGARKVREAAPADAADPMAAL